MPFSEWLSEEFQTAVKKLDGSIWPIVRKRIKKVKDNPFLGKPLSGGPGGFRSAS